jgi:tripartite-type tricarboxylate transporter receptor subunit TctC
MNLRRRQVLQLLVAAAAGDVLTQPARALDYPIKPIRWIVGFPAGGAADLVSRILAPRLTERLGQPIIIENRPGAATNISLQAAIGSPPDGYTVIWLGITATVNPSLLQSVPFNLLRDIAPVSGVADFPFVFVVNKAIQSKNVAEFIAYAKANPGKISMASFGTGTISHLAGELFKMMAGIDMVHVPYRSGEAALLDMISDRVQVTFTNLVSLPHIRSGELRTLAMAGKSRYEGLLGVPTVGETVAGYEVMARAGVGVPRGTPGEIIERLDHEINAVLADSLVRKRLDDVGATPIFYTAAEFGALMAAETEKWAKVVKFSRVKAQ